MYKNNKFPQLVYLLGCGPSASEKQPVVRKSNNTSTLNPRMFADEMDDSPIEN